ncbi:MAG: glycoside hydrolase family 9 protein [Planctomycetota bacterium]|jgi:endoglucanase|nr:glycoside hydrolase family 9 protein [Planctomycetota bacterium]
MWTRSFALLTLCSSLALALDAKPRVIEIAPVTPDTIRVVVIHGEAASGALEPYVPQADDILEVKGKTRVVYAPDYRIRGHLTNHGAQVLFRPVDVLAKDNWDADRLFATSNVALSSSNDSAFSSPHQPSAIARKSKVHHFRMNALGADANWPPPFSERHTAYLTFSTALTPGKTYRLDLSAAGCGIHDYLHQPHNVVTESVHVTHLGFRPDDPSKHAYLSLWLGTGGAYDFNDQQAFELIDHNTGSTVFSGQASQVRAVDGQDGFGEVHTGTEVLVCDFSSFDTPGTYRLYVPGYGCSYPFQIDDNATWQVAARSAIRGLYHHRSGIALTAPYASWERPRNFHPDDGVDIFQCTTTWAVAPSSDEQTEIHAALNASKTSSTIEAWGGYHDAGDWDRRPQHLGIPRLLLQLYDINPGYWQQQDLNLPPDGSLPDLLCEAVWLVDFYQRMQRNDGGVRGMIELDQEGTQWPDASFTNSLTVLATDADPMTSYLFASVAAQAARVIAPFDSARAAGYQTSAENAMAWAEAWLANNNGAALHHGYRDARNAAALELYRLTGATNWHQLFLQTTAFDGSKELKTQVWDSHDQAFNALEYWLAADRSRDQQVLANVTTAITASGEEWLGFRALFGFGNTRNPYAPPGWGNITLPAAIPLVGAHLVTDDERYLSGLIESVQYSLGANPDNRSYVTGLGHNQPELPLHMDSLTMGTAPPEGIVLYGPHPGYEWSQYLWEDAYVPAINSWPVGERFAHLGGGGVQSNEYTVMQGMGPGAFLWGYLAAQGRDTTPANRPPKAEFSSSSDDLRVQLDASASSDPDGDTLSYTWNYGDGGSASGKTADHTYAAAGSYTITLNVSDGALSHTTSKTVTVSAAAAPLLPALSDPGNLKAGLRYRSFIGTWSALPDFASLSEHSSGIATTLGLDQRPADDNFALSFDGSLLAPADGVYQFTLSSDDGSRLFIDGELVINHDGLHGADSKTGSIGLAQGLHAISVDYFEKSGGQALTVQWTPPGGTAVSIPAAALSHPDTGDQAYQAADGLVVMEAEAATGGAAGRGAYTGTTLPTGSGGHANDAS